jgi:superfamily II DNA or RNA helicase
MQARPYQAMTVQQIQLQQTNLCILPQRAGKSLVMSLAIDSHKFSKVLIIVGFRKIVTQLASYFPDDHTFILAGKEYDHSKRVHLASFQTFANRDITLDQYDCIIIDEFHSRTSQAVYELVNQPNCTKLLFTGTPLTNSNKLIAKGIDHYIQPTTVKELLDNSWLAPTRFMSNSNILGDHAADLKTNKTDFDESMVRQIIKKEDLLQNVLNLIIKHDLDTKHKAVIYLNFISTAEELYGLIKHRNNVFIVHSKLTQSQQELALSQYESASNAVLINVRALSLGWDSPTTDTIIYAMFTKIHSLALQIMWRASTVNPAKLAIVFCADSLPPEPGSCSITIFTFFPSCSAVLFINASR